MGDMQHIPGGSPAQPLQAEALPYRTSVPELPTGLKHDYSGLLEYWQMVRRHKLLVALMTLLGGIVGYMFSLPQPRLYQAHLTIELQGVNQDFLNMRNVNPTVDATSTFDPQYDIQTQVKILQSRALLVRSLARLEERKWTEGLQPPDRLSAWRKALKMTPPTGDQLWAQAVGMAAGTIRVRSSGTTRILDISCDSTNPKVAAAFLNIQAEEYIEQNLESRWQSTEHTGEWLKRQLQDLKIKLERSQDELQNYLRASGLVFTGEKNSAEDNKLAGLQEALYAAQTDRIAKQSKYEMASASPPESLPDILDDAVLKESQHNLDALRRHFAELRITFTPNHPEVRKLQAQITLLEGTVLADRDNILKRIANEFEVAKRRENLLLNNYMEQTRRVTDETAASAHYTLMKQEVDATRTLYETMVQKLKEASIAAALRASNIRVVDQAEPSSTPYKPDTSRFIMMGLLCGVCIGVAVSVTREKADRTLQDPGDAVQYLRIPELGVIPHGDLTLTERGLRHIPAGARAHLATTPNGAGVPERLELASFTSKSSLLAESFRTTLTSILFSGKNGDRPHVIVLTSASPKEGKTTVISNLAIALAEIHHRVLLVDADLRRPRLHRVFNVDNACGLSDLLMDKVPLDRRRVEQAVRQSEVPGLFVVPSGASRYSVSSLLHSSRLPEFLRLARDHYDTVIIDTPPMVNISDARVLARQADAVILVLRAAVTSRDAAMLAKQRFVEDGTPLLGTILNGWNPNTPGYGYYRYYYAGYYHYYGAQNDHGEKNGTGA